MITDLKAHHFEAVIFDMDGLLVDTEPMWFAVEQAMMVRRGIDYTAEHQKQFMGMRMDAFWAGVCAHFELAEPPSVFIAEATAGMVEAVRDAEARPGADALIAWLHERRVPLAIASSSPHALIESVVAARGWGGRIPVRVSADECAQGKPAPDVYLEAARRLGVNPAAVLTFEDSLNGARAAVAAGTVCYGVPDLHHVTPEALAAITPHIFPSLVEVLDVLKAANP
jgi:beta-phosphoglucomutase-like phosphatase (HAD superfamily)